MYMFRECSSESLFFSSKWTIKLIFPLEPSIPKLVWLRPSTLVMYLWLSTLSLSFCFSKSTGFITSYYSSWSGSSLNTASLFLKSVFIFFSLQSNWLRIEFFYDFWDFWLIFGKMLWTYELEKWVYFFLVEKSGKVVTKSSHFAIPLLCKLFFISR